MTIRGHPKEKKNINKIRKERGKVKKRLKQIVAAMLALVIALGMIPVGSISVKAETKNASLSNLGNLGTVNIGDKSESGTWYQTKVGSTPVFCMNLGLACHSGDVYESSTDTYSSDSSNTKKALEAYVGYWYDQTKNQSRKAWVYAQCLMWACEEGQTSKAQLTDVIKQVRSNTGYYNSKSAGDLYDEIFGIEGTVKCDVTLWKSSAYKRQVLMEIVSEPKPVNYVTTNDILNYRQRITIDKMDEDGNPVAQVPFEVTAQNYKELYNFKYNGWGDSEEGEADGDSIFDAVAETDSNGRITYKFNYQIQSQDYGYVPADKLKDYTSDMKKEVKEKMDDDGIKYASDLTKSGAEKLVQEDLDAQMEKINNKYVIKEVNSGSDDMIVNSEYASGKTITITPAGSWTKNKDGEWPETANGTYGDYSKATKLGITNKYKKASIRVNKKVENTSDNKAHGDTSVEGAVYRFYQDAACTNPVTTVYDASGNAKTARDYVINNGTLVTDFIRTKDTVYLKEVEAPEGFFLDETVHKVKADGSAFTDEMKAEALTVDSYETEKKGHLEIYKFMTDGSTGPADFEEGATFEVYLDSKGSYDSCRYDERALLVMDGKGYAKTQEPLAYGKYRVHQTKTGKTDTEKVDDQIVEIGKDITSIEMNNKTYTLLYNNKPFGAYLKVVKKDGNTTKTVLESGTAYVINRVEGTGDQETEKRVIQTYSDGNAVVNIGTDDRPFITDKSGEIMTVKELKSGTYRIYETDAVSGMVIKTKYIEVTISSDSKDNETFTDAEGKTHTVVTYYYVNEEAKGRFTIEKTGEFLTGIKTDDNGNVNFVYERMNTEATFEVYAKENIVTQDRQNTNWFDKDELVATVTTGKGAEFTKECGGICRFTLDKSTGNVEISLPLGKYVVKEIKAPYGHVVSEKDWDLSFEYSDKDTEYVFDTVSCDKEGILKVDDDRARPDISILKKDEKKDIGVADTKFGFYAKDNIYSFDGKLLVKADTLLTTVVTDKDGYAKVSIDAPFMSEGYVIPEEDGEKETAEEVTTDAAEKADAENTLNSGRYYFKEIEISDSYYIDETPIELTLEYKDQNTKQIKAESIQKNTSTESEFGKVKLSDNSELDGCMMEISDDKGNAIAEWISGSKDSVKFTDRADELGYENLSGRMTENGNLIVSGLLHDREYVLIERKPADGFVTAESIVFKLTKRVEENGTVTTDVLIKQPDGNFVKPEDNKVIMKDDVTKVEFSKTDITGEKEVPGCELEVTDKETGVVMDRWTSTKQKHIVEGKYVVGKTYVFTEKRPAQGFATAESVEFTVQDDGKIQKVSMKDETIKIKIVKKDSKNNKKLPGAEFVFKLNGKKAAKVKTNKKGEAFIEGKLEAGTTYEIEETKAPEGYQKVKPFKYKVKDTGEVQIITVKDKREGTAVPDTPNWSSGGAKSPKTGDFRNFWYLYILMAGSAAVMLIAGLKFRRTTPNEKA